MNLKTAFLHTFGPRAKRPHQSHPSLWLVAAVVVALLGTAAAVVRNLDDEPRIAFGTRMLGYLGSLLTVESAASAAAPGARPLQPPR